MQISPWALREGLILRRLDQLVFDGPLDPPAHVGKLTNAASEIGRHDTSTTSRQHDSVPRGTFRWPCPRPRSTP